MRDPLCHLETFYSLKTSSGAKSSFGDLSFPLCALSCPYFLPLHLAHQPVHANILFEKNHYHLTISAIDSSFNKKESFMSY